MSRQSFQAFVATGAALVVALLILVGYPIELRAQSSTISVNGISAPTSQTVSPGASVTVTVAGGGSHVWDYVGLFAQGTDNTAHLVWLYLTGTGQPPSSPLSNATFSYQLVTTPGAYELRFNSYFGQTYAVSGPIVISGPLLGVTLNGQAIGNRLTKFISGNGLAVSSSMIETGGKVGVGTYVPMAPLDVIARSTGGGTAAFMATNGTYAASLPQSDIRASVSGVGLYTTTGNVRSAGIYGFVPTGGHGSMAAAAIFDRLDLNKRIFIGGTQTPDYAPSIHVYDTSTSGTDFIVSGYNGNVGIGTYSPATKLHVVGNSTFSGDTVIGGSIAAKYQDVAEWVDSADALEPGTVVVIDETAHNRVLASSQEYDSRVAGAVSVQPGLILGESGPGRELVAQSGRVRVKVDAAYGAILPGDLLVTSPTKGHAMKSRPLTVDGQALHRPGTVIGKALEPLEQGKREILVLLTLQ